MNVSNENNSSSNSIMSALSSNSNNSTGTSSITNSLYNSATSGNTNTTSIFSFLQNISWFTWIIIIIILTILGFNIFTYLAKGTEITANIVESVSKWVSSNAGGEVTDVAKQTINVSGVGIKTAVNSVADVTNEAVDMVTMPINDNTVTGKQASSSQGSQPITHPSSSNKTNNPLDKSLDDSINNLKTASVQADDSYSSIQRSKGSGKSGWCFIGEGEGIRSCVEVGINDTCMSGDIFPTSAVCVNPNLRV
jgi:hypothetical protein